MLYYLRLSNKPGANYQELKARYLQELIQILRLQAQIKNVPKEFPSPAIFVCNHISYLDIPLLMHLVPQASLVSKVEVASWPIIGRAAERVNTVFVKRGCKESRQQVRETIAQALVLDKKSIGVFPSGTTKIVKSESWRRGVFEIAAEHNIPVIPLRINYTPLRQAAYIDQDNFILHLWAVMRSQLLQVEVEFAEVRYINDPIADTQSIQQWCEEAMAAAPVAVLEPLAVTAALSIDPS
jgi:1-acyl-sn-glycerol-3-phosphate acyltransferase